jgi:hypothetical protein
MNVGVWCPITPENYARYIRTKKIKSVLFGLRMVLVLTGTKLSTKLRFNAHRKMVREGGLDITDEYFLDAVYQEILS